MSNYAPQIPRDTGGAPKYAYGPAKLSLASNNKENAAASSILLLNNQTTEMEITPTATSAFKWLSQTVIDSSVAGTSVITIAGSSNFDFIVPANETRRVVVPQVVTSNETSIAAAQQKFGLAPGLAMKTVVAAGVGSVLTVQL